MGANCQGPTIDDADPLLCAGIATSTLGATAAPAPARSSRCPAPTASDTSAPISPWAKVVLATAASGVAISAVEGRLAPRDLVDRRRAGFAGDRPSAAILGSRSVEGGIRALRSIRSRRLRSARRPACPRMSGSIRSKAVRTVDHHADILYIDLDGAVFCVLFASRMRAPSPPKL